MDLHELAVERSLAFHREISRYLLLDPRVLELARTRVKGWLNENPVRPYAIAWNKILMADKESIAAFLTERSGFADELRQSSPFAGVLGPRERWLIWRRVREQFADSL